MNNFIYAPPQFPRLDLLYRDPYIAVINKPSGLLSVPGRLPEHYDSILSRIRDFCPQSEAVHRLDMDTSGIMVFPLCKKSVRTLGMQFEKRSVRKIYLAEVKGLLYGEGSINAPLRCDWEHRPLQIVDQNFGKKALTFYQAIIQKEHSSLIMLVPHTGRSHQLRVHMAHLGHPILGDRFYGDPKDDTVLHLHASLLALNHPTSGDELIFTNIPAFAAEDVSVSLFYNALKANFFHREHV